MVLSLRENAGAAPFGFQRNDATRPRLVHGLRKLPARSEAAIMKDCWAHSKIVWASSGTASLRRCVEK
jgi:hypothetical protein